MIDPDLIDSVNGSLRTQIRKAISELALTGILEAQRQRLLAQIAEGDENEKPEDLAAKILVYRHRSHELQALQQLGESFVDVENNDA